jgi:hypothetical protein
MVSQIAFLYFASLAWGCLALLPVVKLQEVGQGFYRFFGFTCVGLQTLAVGLAILMGSTFGPGIRNAAWALGVSLFFTLCFTIALKIRVRWFLWGCFFLAVASGLAAVGYFPWVDGVHSIFTGVHVVSAALVMGAVILAMMLGHWYLVTPKLSITPLKRYSAGYILLTCWMTLQIVLSWFFYAGSGTEGDALRREMIFILFRTSWGLLAPLGLSYWIWTTVKMKSTQSATGILYAAMICTMMGEAMGLYLTLRTGVPF